LSAVAKGDAFENRVFESLRKLVESGDLGLNPDCCRLFQKKGYYSRDRGSDIIVDISIEVWLPNADRWSMLWVCECKDYKKPVPVDDVEEFKAKLNQIAGLNVKGLFTTSSAFQSGALNFSRSNGIGLLRLLPNDQIDTIMYFMTPEIIRREEVLQRVEYKRALVTQNHRTKGNGFYSIYDGYVYHSWRSLLKSYFNEVTSMNIK
jgi:hypothetical protein